MHLQSAPFAPVVGGDKGGIKVCVLTVMRAAAAYNNAATSGWWSERRENRGVRERRESPTCGRGN